jgi:hypothetical protein
MQHHVERTSGCLMRAGICAFLEPGLLVFSQLLSFSGAKQRAMPPPSHICLQSISQVRQSPNFASAHHLNIHMGHTEGTTTSNHCNNKASHCSNVPTTIVQASARNDAVNMPSMCIELEWVGHACCLFRTCGAAKCKGELPSEEDNTLFLKVHAMTLHTIGNLHCFGCNKQFHFENDCTCHALDKYDWSNLTCP